MSIVEMFINDRGVITSVPVFIGAAPTDVATATTTVLDPNRSTGTHPKFNTLSEALNGKWRGHKLYANHEDAVRG